MLYAALVDRPYQLSWDEVANLTDRQILDIYLRPRDKNGIPLPPEEDSARSSQPDTSRPVTEDEAREKYFAMAATLKMPRKLAEEKWAAWKEAKANEQQQGSPTQPGS